MGHQETLAVLTAAADRLAGESVTAIVPAGQGANSRVFRVELRSRTLALKSYPARLGDARDRLQTEWTALRFLRSRNIHAVPKPLARDRQCRLMLMEWIEGESIIRHTLGDLEDAISFIVRISQLSSDADASRFKSASEACFSLFEIAQQIDARLLEFAPHPSLDAFLEKELLPALVFTKDRIAAQLRQPEKLALRYRRLIPADFGFHNALRQSDGRLRFIDFDYFGWDDPVKLTADFLLHPAMNLSEIDKKLFKERMTTALGDDESFAERLDQHLPLYAVRWALILLNPFRFDRRETSPGDRAVREALLAGRIEKARAMCERAVVDTQRS